MEENLYQENTRSYKTYYNACVIQTFPVMMIFANKRNMNRILNGETANLFILPDYISYYYQK